MRSFYDELSRDAGDSELPYWVWRRWSGRDLESLPSLDGTLLKQAAFQMQRGKSCASDMLVAEMLFQLDDDVWEAIAQTFRMRMLNHVSEDEDEAWDEQVVQLLRKKVAPKTVKDFRPITILPMLQKLYSRVLLLLSGTKLDKLTALQFASGLTTKPTSAYMF